MAELERDRTADRLALAEVAAAAAAARPGLTLHDLTSMWAATLSSEEREVLQAAYPVSITGYVAELLAAGASDGGEAEE